MVYCDCPSHNACTIMPPINPFKSLDYSCSSKNLKFSEDNFSIDCPKGNCIRTAQTRTPFLKDDQKKINYFEMKIDKIGDNLCIGLGLYSHPFDVFPGRTEHSFGFFSDGSVYRSGEEIGNHKYKCWEKNDVVGCCLDYELKRILFSHNGVLIPTIINWIEETKLIPTIGFGYEESKVALSFGSYFQYDPEKLLQDIPIYREILSFIIEDDNNKYIKFSKDIFDMLGLPNERIIKDLYSNDDLSKKSQEEIILTENICATAFVVRFLRSAEKVYYPEFCKDLEDLEKFINTQSKYVLAPSQLGLASTWIQYASKILYKYSTIPFYEDQRLRESLDSKGCSVFLGGSCNPTTWRVDIAIPMLEEANISYYNPQVDEWTPDLVEIEAEAKDNAHVLFFVIDNETYLFFNINVN